MHRRLAEIEQRREVADDMAWVYKSLSHPAEIADADKLASLGALQTEEMTPKERVVMELLAAGKSPEDIRIELGLNRAGVTSLILNVEQVLGNTTVPFSACWQRMPILAAENCRLRYRAERDWIAGTLMLLVGGICAPSILREEHGIIPAKT